MDHGRAHATLSPSAAERWLSCPASVRMIASLPAGEDDSTSEFAEEGTRAHALGEIKASLAFGLITQEDYDAAYDAWLASAVANGDDVEEMQRHTDAYVELLQDLAAGLGEPYTVRLEIRVQTGIPGCWGTADAAIIGVTKIVVVDFKYGKGVAVQVVGNPQAKLYGVGVLRLVDLLGTVQTVTLAICQPRNGGNSTDTMSAGDLLAWADGEVAETARETQHPDARFGPSEQACRWCPAAGLCKPRAAQVAQRDFGNPDLMTPEELAEAFGLIDDLRDWCKAVDAAALAQAYSHGVTLPGLKVVLSGGKRSIRDKAAAVDRLVALGYDRDEVARDDVQTLTVLDRVVGGKEALAEALGDLLNPGMGSPSLVSDADARPSITKADEVPKDFQAETPG